MPDSGREKAGAVSSSLGFLFFFKLINLFYLFIFGCVGSSLLRACFLQLR